MDKKPLIGVSICAVVLLVLGSLSNVAGYQSVKSTMVSDSPLFSMRTQRATNQQLHILTSQYLGKGKEIRIHIPERDKRTETINMLLNNIKRMDDTSLRRLAFLINYNLPQNNEVKEFNYEQIFQALKELRDNPDIDIHNIQKSKDSKIRSNACSLDCTMVFSDIECWPFLIVFCIILILDVLIFIPVSAILELLTIAC